MPVIKIENLEAEMKRNKISRSDIAHTLGLSYRTIGSYLFVSDRIRRGGVKTKPVRLYDWQKNLLEILYLIFDYQHKYYTFKYFEI